MLHQYEVMLTIFLEPFLNLGPLESVSNNSRKTKAIPRNNLSHLVKMKLMLAFMVREHITRAK